MACPVAPRIAKITPITTSMIPIVQRIEILSRNPAMSKITPRIIGIYLLVNRVNRMNRSGVHGKVRAQQAQHVVVAPETGHLPMPGRRDRGSRPGRT
jgi:hypothetical protein